MKDKYIERHMRQNKPLCVKNGTIKSVSSFSAKIETARKHKQEQNQIESKQTKKRAHARPRRKEQIKKEFIQKLWNIKFTNFRN